MKKVLVVIVAVIGIGLGAWLFWGNAPAPTVPLVVSVTQSNGPVQVFPGVGGAYFVLPDRSLWSWGGEGPVPRQVGTNRDWSMALKLNNHTIGIRTNGTLWEWGYRGAGRHSANAEQVDGRTNWVGISGGDVHGAALNADGTIWAWGDNASCQLGNGPRPDSADTVQVGTESDWRAIGAGQGSYTMGIKRDGSLWVWGQVPYYMNGTQTTIFGIPQRICSETNWTKFNWLSSCVENSNGELWYPFGAPPGATVAASSACYLYSTNWQSGRTAIASTGISTGYSFLMRVKPDGTLWRWKYTPRQGLLGGAARVGTRSDWVGIWGHGTAYGLTSDGTIWAVGQDFGRGSQLDMKSQVTRWMWEAAGYVHLPRGSWSGQGSYPAKTEFWPLMRVAVETPAK